MVAAVLDYNNKPAQRCHLMFTIEDLTQHNDVLWAVGSDTASVQRCPCLQSNKPQS